MNSKDDGPEFSSSLRSLLSARNTPLENQVFIEQFCKHLGITDFQETSSYIKAIRTDGNPNLQIEHGWTNGFSSEAEAREATGKGADVWESGRGTGLWGVSHPINKIGNGGGGPARPKRDFGVCPNCLFALPATGECDNCG